jgi:HNH endonuclease
VELFHYPKTIHNRTLAPRPFVNYQTYKKYLRIEFKATCVYCRMPDRFSEKNYYAVEHYKPKKKFPELKAEYSNLFYACGTCNTWKGEFWPSDEQIAANIFVPNPCDYRMYDHLRSHSNGTVTAATQAGKWTVDLLCLNEPLQIEKRLFYLNAKKTAERRMREVLSTLKALRQKEQTIVDEEHQDLLNDIAKLEIELGEAEKILAHIGG